jgi:hypothetical protein
VGTWDRYRRAGIVTAHRRDRPWTWTAQTGDVLSGDTGDWEVTDGDESSWSVTDDIFRASYRHLGGDRWERRGEVVARPAIPGEVVETLEGPVVAVEGDYVIQGEQGEQWPVPGPEFARRYRGPLR